MSEIVRLIGDIHGKWYDYQLITQPIEHKSIQLGDFGIGFGQGEYWHDRVNDFHSSGQHSFIRGNHDNPSICKKDMAGWIKDGTVTSHGDNTVMAIGGAWSIDYAYRTEGVSWWRDEELSYHELDTMIDIYSATKPDIMITHDAPTLASYRMFIKNGKAMFGGKTLHLTRTGEALQAMFEIHQPKFWWCGHWHNTIEMDIDGTHFHCLDELDFVDFDFENLEYVKTGI